MRRARRRPPELSTTSSTPGSCEHLRSAHVRERKPVVGRSSRPLSCPYPFHLHVWPFQVLATSTARGAEQSLRDVVLVPARGWARLRVHFADFAGRSVYHCHILDHEDTGMMATIEVAP
ncbi:MAG: multicopper oxidase domain-containing protein [Actinomycetia bacterium]|nr:multicopper oxidase domain-containing protein [Actinomycetes bacterium]